MNVTQKNNREPDRRTSNGNNHLMACGAAGENPTKRGGALWAGFDLCRLSIGINHQAVPLAILDVPICPRNTHSDILFTKK